MKAMALKQLQAASPQMYDPKAVDTQILKVIGYDNPDSLFAPPVSPAPPPPDPQLMVAEIMKQIEQMKQENNRAIKELDAQTKLILEKMRAEEKAKDRELKREGMVADIAVKLAEHPDSEEVVDRTFTKDIP
jgi:hypothetical protein